jgi:hypothetical protein
MKKTGAGTLQGLDSLRSAVGGEDDTCNEGDMGNGRFFTIL